MINRREHPDQPSSTVSMRTPSVPHTSFGRLVVIVPSCWADLPWGRRCGDIKAFSRISRSTRVRETRISPRIRDRDHTVRCPSPMNGETPDRPGWPPEGRRRASWVSGRAAVPRVAPHCSTRAPERHRSSNAEIRAPADSLQPIRLAGAARSSGSFRRPPVDQRVSGLPFLAQQFVFHDQLANAPGRLTKPGLQRIVLALLQASIDTGQGTLAPFFEPVYRYRNFARNGISGSPRKSRKTTCSSDWPTTVSLRRPRRGRFQSRYALLPPPPAQPWRSSTSSACSTPFPETRFTQNRVQKNRRRFNRHFRRLSLRSMVAVSIESYPIRLLKLAGSSDDHFEDGSRRLPA